MCHKVILAHFLEFIPGIFCLMDFLSGAYPNACFCDFFVQPEPEFRPPMSEVVQQLVRLMQRASIVRRQSGEELGFSYRAPEREGDTRDISF